MAEETTEEELEEEPPKKSKMPMLIGLVMFLLLGGGGFFAVYSGMILAPEPTGEHAEQEEEPEALPLPDVAFVPIEPLVITLGKGSSTRYLKFDAQLEVEPDAESDVTDLLPRVVDVMNGYLRAVSMTDLEEPTALIKLRAQMLRRIQIVTGEGRVRDLLIMEFVLN
ncbi:flagellar basal body-associated protein FliL [Candidatus Rhodobacter oscarellae]|uniref:Flagellar protein FliL n=1 Tax=Candidatus Rhodobacter oscarellae TaxID=1675527 RepID=A0A0J9E8M8_9RHOB|nr:flagellar basal body-associated FliL family protein [Candidatus Rhodobacter lobularis]KMW59026.1 flagellar basal body-associated protein FliL [Candidatus Rhodobacter lobularis]